MNRYDRSLLINTHHMSWTLEDCAIDDTGKCLIITNVFKWSDSSFHSVPEDPNDE